MQPATSHAVRRGQLVPAKPAGVDALAGCSHGSEGEASGANLALPTPRPTSLLSAARTDPFQSFARPVTETEGFLIDHCTSRL